MHFFVVVVVVFQVNIWRNESLIFDLCCTLVHYSLALCNDAYTYILEEGLIRDERKKKFNENNVLTQNKQSNNKGILLMH